MSIILVTAAFVAPAHSAKSPKSEEKACFRAQTTTTNVRSNILVQPAGRAQVGAAAAGEKGMRKKTQEIYRKL